MKEEDKKNPDTKVLKLSPMMQHKVAEMLTQQKLVQERLASYLQGYTDSLGLIGDYNLDINTWRLEPRSESADKVKESHLNKD